MLATVSRRLCIMFVTAAKAVSKLAHPVFVFKAKLFIKLIEIHLISIVYLFIYHLSIISRLHVLTLDSESLTKKSPSCPFSAMSTSHSCLVMGPKYQDLPRTSSLPLLKSADTPLLAPAQLSIALHSTVDCYPLFAAREVPLEFGASGVPFFAPTSWVRN